MFKLILLGKKSSQRGEFQFLLILNLWSISFHAVVVFGLGKNLLFKSILGRCASWLHQGASLRLDVFLTQNLELRQSCYQVQINIQFEDFRLQVAMGHSVSSLESATEKHPNGFTRKKLVKGQKARSSRPQHATQWCVLTKNCTVAIFMICLISYRKVASSSLSRSVKFDAHVLKSLMSEATPLATQFFKISSNSGLQASLNALPSFAAWSKNPA